MKLPVPHSNPSHSATCCVLLFLRLPALGKVKTRLAAGIGTVHALEVYRCFILDELAMLDTLDASIIVCFTPEDGRRECASWLGSGRDYLAQAGGDLGARMDAAFQEAFTRGFERVVLMGSDIPDIPGSVLTSGLACLQGHDACLAPSLDGGYYCIGFNRSGYCPAVFRQMAWSTQQVCAQTRSILMHHNRSLHLLKPWQDVDTRDDLAALCRRIEQGEAAAHTRAYLKNTGLWDDLVRSV